MTKRIVSLIASATEIVCALGLRNQLVGRSHECDFPESVKTLPVCTRPKFEIQGTSREIDEQVKAVLREAYAPGSSSVKTATHAPEIALSVYEVFSDVLEQLKPDVIITQSHCKVCAVSLSEVEEALSGLVHSRPKIVSLEPNALSDIWRGIEQVARALDLPERGQQLVLELSERMTQISNRSRKLELKPTVALIEWIDPLMAAGNWMPELVELAGGRNLFGHPGKHSQCMNWEDLVGQNPDVIVVAPCGFEIKRARRDMPILTQKKEWVELKSVQNGQVFLVDGNQYFNRPGPRLVESLEILAEITHPNEFHFENEGTKWERL